MAKKKHNWDKIKAKCLELYSKDSTLDLKQLASKFKIDYNTFRQFIKIEDIRNEFTNNSQMIHRTTQETLKEKAKEDAAKQYLSLIQIENMIDKSIIVAFRQNENIEYKDALKLKVDILKEKGQLVPEQPELEELRNLFLQLQ